MNCPACGRPNPPDAARCTACGAALTTIVEQRTDMLTGGSRGAQGAGLSIGALLGTRYEIQALLGEGGMGAVYKAHDRELDRTVAIKVIRPEMASRPEVLERFKREILLASKVTHKNVLRIHDFGEAGELKFISMNYVEGSSLNALLEREGPLPLDRAMPLVRQMAEALAAAHDAGIVHRDLKPQNILIDRDGNAYIADFGISRSMETGGTITEVGALLGTVAYMSPEQARGERPDHRGDIYSFGVILFQMLTGTIPFTGGDALSVLMKRVHEEPPSVKRVRPQVPGWMSEIVARALRRDPADRYQSVGELLSDLERRHASASWRRIRRRVLLPAAALLAVVAVGVWAVRSWKPRIAASAGPKTSLAVLPFQNATGDSRYDWARDGLPSLLRDGLVQAKDLHLFGEDRVQEVVESLRAPEGEEARPANMRRIATLIGADNVLAGKILKIADRLRIEATIQRAGSQDTSGPPLTVDGSGDAAIQTMLSDLTPRVLDALGVSRGWLDRARGAAKPMTRSAEALALHGQGLALVHAGKYLDASKKLEEAVQKDSSFFVARALLAETYQTLGYAEKATSEAKKAAEGLGTASPYEAARIQATVALIDGDLKAAEKAYTSLCEITPSDPGAFFQLASVREQGGDLNGAVEPYRKVVALDPKYASAHVALGRVLFFLGNQDDAAKELNAALALYEETGSDEGKANVLNGLGNVYLEKAQYGEALSRFRQSLEIRQRIGDRKGMHKCLTNIALVHARQGEFDESIKAVQQAVDIARDMKDRVGLANTLSELGDDYQSAAQPENAMKAYQESLKIFREKGVTDPPGEARALANLGNANTLLGRSVEALYSLKDALAKRREIGDKAEIVRSLSDIGDNERLQGGYEEALKYYTEGLTLARAIPAPTYVMVFLGSLSNVHEDQGDFGAALSLIAEAEKLARDGKDEWTLSSFMTFLGSVRRRLGDYSGAKSALDEAMVLAKKTHNTRVEAEVFTQAAALALGQGVRDGAGNAAKAGLAIAKRVGEPWMVLRVRLAQDEAARSVQDLELVVREAEAAGLVPVVGAAHLALARVHLLEGRGRDALREADLAVTTATGLGQRDALFQAHGIAGRALAQDGDRAKAAERFVAALAPLEEIRRGLRDEPLQFFLGRPETTEFGKNAGEILVVMHRADDAARLQGLLKP